MIALIPPRVPAISLTPATCLPNQVPRRRPAYLGHGYRKDYRALVRGMAETARLQTDGRPVASYRVMARYPLGPWERTRRAAWRSAWEWLATDAVEGGAA